MRTEKLPRKLFLVLLVNVAILTYFMLQLPKPNNANVSDEVTYYQNISECFCSRKYFYAPGNFSRRNSSCSDEGTFYKESQNVIAFTFYLPDNPENASKFDKNYIGGLYQNLEMMRKYYPGYSTRVYTGVMLTGNYCGLVCNNEDLFWCQVKITPSHGDLSGMVFRTWRFLPLGDPTVDLYLSRDLDSLINERESVVVKEWLSLGNKAISIMHDRPGDWDPILSGTWQTSNKMLGYNRAGSLRERIIGLSKKPSEHTYKRSDQVILTQVIFQPENFPDIVAYDSYTCEKWENYTMVRPFPIQRGNPNTDVIANVMDFAGGTGWFNFTAEICPPVCRPSYGKDWLYC